MHIIVLLNTSSSIQQFSAEGISSNAGPDRSLHEKMGMRTAHVPQEFHFTNATNKGFHGPSNNLDHQHICARNSESFLPKRMVFTEDLLRTDFVKQKRAR